MSTVPTSPEAERAVLGAIMIDPEAIQVVSEFLQPQHFYSEKNRIIYTSMLALDSEGRDTDSISVSEHLRLKNKLDEVGSIPYLVGMMEENPGTWLVEQHANMILETARLRALQAFAYTIQGQVAGGGTAQDLIANAEQALSELNTEANEAKGLADDYLREAEGLLSENMRGYVQTGFYNLDRMLGGIKGMTILAARPSAGKSSVARDIARNAIRAGKKVALLSPDQSGADIFRLEASLASGVELTRIKERQYSLDEAAKWKAELGKFRELCSTKLILDDRPLTLPSLNARYRAAVRQDVDLVIIDYMQLVDVPGIKADSEYHAVTAVSKALKRLARETGVPALVLAQLNRGVESRNDPRPIMSDLRSSGQIEQDADSIVFIHRPFKHEHHDEEYVEFIVAKQKDGPIGTVNLKFRRAFSTFLNL